MDVHLNRIGTAVPPNDVHARFVAVAPEFLHDTRLRRLFVRMADRCQIEHRWSYLKPGAGPLIDAEGFYRFGRFPGTAARMRLYERQAPELAAQALDALDLGDERRRVTHLIVGTCTGFYAPGLDLQIAARLGLPDGVERTVVGFMGCHAAINVLRLARHTVRSVPEARVLVVLVELCSLHLQETSDLEQLLSFLIFGDGCAAGLVSADPVGLVLQDFRSLTLPGTGENITWRIGDQGFDMQISGAVPACLAASLRDGGIQRILGGDDPQSVDLWAIHPGGRSVLDAVEEAIGLEPDRLEPSRGVLRDYGNMSSATVMFVLDRMMRSAVRGNGAGCAMAFGPGMSAEAMIFRMAA